jgi:hypothetical protein
MSDETGPIRAIEALVNAYDPIDDDLAGLVAAGGRAPSAAAVRA